MAHKHTCLNCGAVTAEGDFDCEVDRDHDFDLCDACASPSVKAAVIANSITLEDFELWNAGEVSTHLAALMVKTLLDTEREELQLFYSGGVPIQDPSQIQVLVRGATRA